MAGTVYLIPTFLYENQTDCLPACLLPAIKECSVFFTENERTTRRYFKLLDREIVIDDYEWVNMKQASPEVISSFKKKIKENKTIGVLSEAGCPGIADPGQHLVEVAHEMNATIKPFVGPSSILLALMSSGMNGQQFCFHGYLPIDAGERMKLIRQLETESLSKKQTQIFIETPYRNNQLLEAIIRSVNSRTKICVAADLTAPSEFIKTQTAGEWKKKLPDLHKRPAIFLLEAGK